MSLFNKLGEIFRDHSRDRLCAALQDLEITAQMAGHDRPEERITSFRGKSLGVIDIPGGPISWINIKKNRVPQSGTDWHTEYGVPDPQVSSTFPPVFIKTVRIKDLPVVGKIIDLRWSGEDFDLSIIDRLTGDDSLSQPIIESYDLEIEAYPKHGCWLLTVRNNSPPTGRVWGCYQSIAHHLLTIQQ